MNGKWK